MNFNQIKFGKPVTYLDGVVNYLKGAMIWGFRSKYKWSQTTPDIWGFANPNNIDPESQAVYNRIIADGGVSDLTRLNYFVVGLKTIYGSLTNVPVCYDAHWIGYKLGSGTGTTAGQAAAKLYSLTVAGDAVQATAASQPLLLAHNGASSDNYWWGSGVSGNYVASNSNTSFQFNTDFSISLSGIFTSGTILSKFSGSNYVELTQNSGTIRLTYYNGSTFPLNIIFGAVSTSVFTYLKLNRVGNDYTLTQSTDNITFTLVGTSTNTTVIPTINSPLYVSNGGAYASNGVGKFYSIIYHNNGTFSNIVVDFNPATYNAATSQTAWTSATGEIWTISTGTATTGYKGVLVDRAIVQTDGIDDEMSTAAFAINQPNTSYTGYVYFNDLSKTVVDGLTNDTRNMLTASTVGVTGLYAGTATFIVSGFTKFILQLRTFGLNGASSYGMANNSSRTTGTAGTLNASGVHLFKGGNTFNNITFNFHIQSNILDSTTQNTAMYNLLRSLNNNAF